MCLVLPITHNYTQGWKQTEMTIETVKKHTNQKGCTLAEIIHKDHIIKPYVDIDRKVPHTLFAEENQKTLS